MSMKKISFFALILVCWAAQTASAQLLIEQGKIKKVVAPGQAVAESITVHNSTGDTVGVRVYLEDFEYVTPFDGGKKFYPAGSTARSASSWVNFEPKEFQLPPYGKRDVNFTANIPEGISGGYYSVLFFERTDKQAMMQGDIGLQIVSRVGSILFFETADRQKAIDVTNISVGDGALHADLVNKGNINLVAKCFYYILDGQGIPVDRGELESYYMPENGTVSFSFPVKKGLSAGLYTAVLTFDLEDGVSSVHEVDLKVGAGGEIEVAAHRN